MMTLATANAVDSAVGCVDSLHRAAANMWWNPAEAAGWYSAIAGIFAAVSITILVVRFGDSDRKGRTVDVIWLFFAFTVSALSAVAMGELSGEHECNSALVGMGNNGSELAVAVIVMFLAATWAAEGSQAHEYLQLVEALFVAIVIFAAATLSVTIIYGDSIITDSLDGAHILLWWGPAAVFIFGATALRLGHGRPLRPAMGLLAVFGAVAVLFAVQVYLTAAPPRSVPGSFPWVSAVDMAAFGFSAGGCILSLPRLHNRVDIKDLFGSFRHPFEGDDPAT
jgi:hypothetical protein